MRYRRAFVVVGLASLAVLAPASATSVPDEVSVACVLDGAFEFETPLKVTPGPIAGASFVATGRCAGVDAAKGKNIRKNITVTLFKSDKVPRSSSYSCAAGVLLMEGTIEARDLDTEEVWNQPLSALANWSVGEAATITSVVATSPDPTEAIGAVGMQGIGSGASCALGHTLGMRHEHVATWSY